MTMVPQVATTLPKERGRDAIHQTMKILLKSGKSSLKEIGRLSVVHAEHFILSSCFDLTFDLLDSAKQSVHS